MHQIRRRLIDLIGFVYSLFQIIHHFIDVLNSGKCLFSGERSINGRRLYGRKICSINIVLIKPNESTTIVEAIYILLDSTDERFENLKQLK